MKKNLLSLAFIAGLSTMTLAQSTYNLPFIETFETTSASRANWTNINVVGLQNWTYAEGSSGGTLLTAHNGSSNARFYSGSGTNSPTTKLVSPIINAGTNTQAYLEFYHANPIWATDVNALKVYYRLNETSEWIQLFSQTEAVESWKRERIQLPSVSTTMQIAFEGINNWGRANVIDDVKVIGGTSPMVVQLPFHETFEEDSQSRIGWTQQNVIGAQNWVYATGSSGGAITTANNGTLNARFYSGSGENSPITKLITPIIDAGTARKAYLQFSFAQPDWTGDFNKLKVYYRLNETSEWIQLYENSTAVDSWTEKRFALPTVSREMQFAFEGINNWGRANVLDDIHVVEGDIPPLPEICGVNNVSNDMENGIGNTINAIYANDFRVNAISKLDISQVSFNLATTTSGITTATFKIVEDNNGVPGDNVIYEFTGTPDTTESLGTNFNFNFSKYTYNLPEIISLENTTNTHKRYWLKVQSVQPISGTNAYWETTSQNSSEFRMMYYDDTETSWKEVSAEGVFTIEGECSIIERSLPCEFETPSNGIENGHGSIATGEIANDFTINPGSDFHLDGIDMNILSTSGINSATLKIYENNNGEPGNLITSFNATPTNRVSNGTNFGFNSSTYTFTLPETLTLESGSYWLGISQTVYTTGTTAYWESTSILNSAHKGKFKGSTGLWSEFTTGEWDGVFKLVGGCQRLTINDQVIEVSQLSFYPNPVTDVLFIKHKLAVNKVDVFNLAGQNVLTTKINANGSVNLVNLTKGVYIVNATLADGTNQTFKVIKK